MWLVDGAKKVSSYIAGSDRLKPAGAEGEGGKREGGAAPEHERRGASVHQPAPSGSGTPAGGEKKKPYPSKEWNEAQRDKLLAILNKSVVDIEALQQVSWAGIPNDLRPICWQLMLGYLPRQASGWQDVITCKRKAYRDLLARHYDVSNSRRSEEELAILRQIAIDAPRTEPTVKLFGKSALQVSASTTTTIGFHRPTVRVLQLAHSFLSPCLPRPLAFGLHSLNSSSSSSAARPTTQTDAPFFPASLFPFPPCGSSAHLLSPFSVR